MTMCHKPHSNNKFDFCKNNPSYKFVIPHIPPLDNIIMSSDMLAQIHEYKENFWAIGQSYPNGGPDKFTYFFSIRGIEIYNFLVSPTLQIGSYSAYDKNIENLTEYINYNINFEIKLIDLQIVKIKLYKSKDWAIGESYPEPGPDQFVVFFAKRNLPIAAYLRGTVNIGDPSAYDVNIATLEEYKQRVLSFLAPVTHCEVNDYSHFN